MGSHSDDGGRTAVLIGGSGFVGSVTAGALRDKGWDVTVIDVVPPPDAVLAAGATWRRADLLTDEVCVPEGEVVLFVGNGDPRTRWAWHQPLQTVATTGRLLPELAGREVTLCSTLEVYGTAPAPLTEESPTELPWGDEKLRLWLDRGRWLFERPCPPWDAAAWCQELLAADPSGRWVYGMSKRAQELLLGDALDEGQLTILRLANTVGPGQERVVSRLARRAIGGRTLDVSHPVERSFLPAEHIASVIAGRPGPGVFNVGAPSVELMAVARHLVDSIGRGATLRVRPVGAQDSCGVLRRTALDDRSLGVPPVWEWLDGAVERILADESLGVHPPVGVVVPPRSVRPDVVAERQQVALWSGAVKHGNEWSRALEDDLSAALDLDAGQRLLATTSGTDALRVMCGAICGPAVPGQVAVVPSFTFPATAEVVAQLGYRIRFVDVDPIHWTMDASSLREALAPGDVAFVVAVDTFGHPVDYPALQFECDAAGVPLLADSAAALGTTWRGRPVGTQAIAHSYSMSFAKVLSAGGAGGAVVLPEGVALDGPFGWTRSALMNELHAVVALDQLAVLEEMVVRRNRCADLYIEAGDRLGLDHQRVHPDARHSWVHFVFRIEGGAAERDRVSAEMARLGVGTKAYFLPLHSDGGEFGSVRVDGPTLRTTDQLGEQALAVPMSSELNDEMVDRICIALEAALP